MDRRQYLAGVGSSIGTLPLVARTGGATDHISVDIVETTASLEGGDLLDVTGELEKRISQTLAGDLASADEVRDVFRS